jgi:hypothetical protein
MTSTSWGSSCEKQARAGYTVTKPTVNHALIKKKRKFSSDIRKFRMEQLQRHI